MIHFTHIYFVATRNLPGNRQAEPQKETCSGGSEKTMAKCAEKRENHGTFRGVHFAGGEAGSRTGLLGKAAKMSTPLCHSHIVKLRIVWNKGEKCRDLFFYC